MKVPVAYPKEYEIGMKIEFMSVTKASLATLNQIITSINAKAAVTYIFPLTIIIVLTVPIETSKILAKNIFKHKKTKLMVSPINRITTI